MVRYPSPDSARVEVRAHIPSALSAVAVFARKDGSIAGRATLYDDGAHNDGAAGDQNFGGAWVSRRASVGVDFSIVARYVAGDSVSWPGGRCLSLAGPARARLRAVESDHLNFDGIANPGENVRISVEISNPSPFPLGPWRVSNGGFGDRIPETLVLDSVIAPLSSVSKRYEMSDATSYLAFDVPAGAADGERFALPVDLEAANNNCWCDTLLLTAHAFSSAPIDSTALHVSGRCDGDLGWRVVLPDSLRNHAYRITVNGSLNQHPHTITVTDLTTPRLLLLDAPIPSSTGHESPVLDGFKLFGRGLVDNWLDSTYSTWGVLLDTMLSVRYEPQAHRWYTENTPTMTGEEFFGSTLSYLDLLPVTLVFDRRYTQKAYHYVRGATPNYGCTGYFDIPIRAYDVSNPSSPRQLQLAFVEQRGSPSENNTWDPKTAADREYLFVINVDYDTVPKATFLSYKINSDAPKMPILYATWMYATTPTSTFIDGDSLMLRQRIPITSRDTFFIHPNAPRTATTRPGAPALLSPRDGAIDLPTSVRLLWTPGDGADFSSVQLASNASFTSNVRTVGALRNGEYLAANLGEGTLWYWRAAGTNVAGTGPWSAAWSFRTKAALVLTTPKQLAPTNGATEVDTLPTFRWSRVPGAVSYTLQVGDSLLTLPFDINVTITDTVYRATHRLHDPACWVVQAVTGGTTSFWSPRWYFRSTSPRPVLRNPKNNTTLATVNTVLEWGASHGATSYRVQCNTVPPSSWSIDSSGVIDTSFALTNLQPDRQYQWRVNALNAAGPSEWSEMWNLFTPTLIAVRPVPVNASDIDLSIHPQPATDYIDVTIGMAVRHDAVSITLADVLGRRLAERRIDAGIADTPLLRFSTASFPPGTYLVRATCGGTSRLRSFVISR
jgi:hypothetical protein